MSCKLHQLPWTQLQGNFRLPDSEAPLSCSCNSWGRHSLENVSNTTGLTIQWPDLTWATGLRFPNVDYPARLIVKHMDKNQEVNCAKFSNFDSFCGQYL